MVTAALQLSCSQRSSLSWASAHPSRTARDPSGAGKPRTLTADQYEHARSIVERGGWTRLDPALLQAVPDGPRPGDPLPPLEAEARIVGVGPDRRVVVFFSYEAIPGVRFGHRFEPDERLILNEEMDLMEDIETGALHRMMRDPPRPDEDGVGWAAFSLGR